VVLTELSDFSVEDYKWGKVVTRKCAMCNKDSVSLVLEVEREPHVRWVQSVILMGVCLL
jgi:hypothetical protein